MSYIDAYFEKSADKIHVVERKNGERVYQTFPAEYVFYYTDPKGKQRSIYGDRVSRFKTHNAKEFHKESKIHSTRKLFESDINPVFRCLANNYLGADSPELNVAFFDIEVDFDPERGYSSPEDPFNAVTSIAVYCSWSVSYTHLTLPTICSV